MKVNTLVEIIRKVIKEEVTKVVRKELRASTISNKKDAYGLVRAERNNIPIYYFPYIRKIEVESVAKKTIDIIDNPLIANVDSLYKIVYENINAVIEARKLEKFYKYL